MAIRTILHYPDPRLREVAKPVTEVTDELRVLIQDMAETMYAAPGVGLAANQVGVLKRLFTYEFPGLDEDEEPTSEFGAVVNPVILDASDDAVEDDEGCLSFPGLFYPVERPQQVEIAWQDLDGDEHTRQLTEFEARVWLHEMDHLNGVLFIDHLAKHDRKEAMKLMRQYREEHGVDVPGQGKLANLLLGGGSPS